MPTDKWSGKSTSVIAPPPVTLTFLQGDSRKVKRRDDEDDSQDDIPQDKRIRSVSPTRFELSAQEEAISSRDVPMGRSPSMEPEAKATADTQMGEATSSQAAPSGEPPSEAGRHRRKCFDGYYRMMTIREWTGHLTEREEEYAMLREAEAELG